MRVFVPAIFLLMLLGPSQVLASTTPEEQYRKALGFLLTPSPTLQDRDEALKLLRTAGDQKYVPAATALGTIYDRSSVAVRDLPQAVSWYEKAAKEGDWIAQLALGRIYFVGDGVARDTSLAKKWLRMAADSGDAGAAFYMGLLNDAGQGTATNYEEAAKWYRQAAESGNSFAQQKLAQLLLNGISVTRDQQQAYMWLLVASGFGNHSVDGQLRSIEADLGMSGADAARQQAVSLREQILQRVGRNACNGWQGQFAELPEPPPLLFQMACENLKQSTTAPN